MPQTTALDSFRQACVPHNEIAHAVAVEDQIMQVLHYGRRHPFSEATIKVIDERVRQALDDWPKIAECRRQELAERHR